MKKFVPMLVLLCLLAALSLSSEAIANTVSTCNNKSMNHGNLLTTVEPLFSDLYKPGPVQDPTPSASDWVVTGEEVHENEVIVLTGNLIIEHGGNLTLKNCKLYLNCSYDGEWGIRVRSGGALNVIDESLIASYDGVHYFYFHVHGRLVMKNSLLSRCGYSSSEPGLWIETMYGARIERTVIANCYYGLVCYDARNVIVRECEIYGCEVGMFLSDDAHNIVVSDSIISATDLCVGVDTSSFIAFSSCELHGGDFSGALVQYSTNVTFEDCRIQDSDKGACIAGSQFITFRECVIFNSATYGLAMLGVVDSEILYCEFYSNSGNGVICGYSENVAIIGCNIHDNAEAGVCLAYARNIVLRDNVLHKDGLIIEGGILECASHTIVDNTVNGKSLYYIVNSTGFTVPSDAGQVIIVNSEEITVTGLNLSNADVGVEIAFSEDVTVQYSIIEHNDVSGVLCFNSFAIEVLDCDIRYNEYGMYIYSTTLHALSSSPYCNEYEVYSGPPCIDVHHCNIYGNLMHGLYSDTDATINATENWWGSISGPEFNSEGDPDDPEEIYCSCGSGYILFVPWLVEEIIREPPIIEVIAPENLSYVKDTVMIEVDASDSEGVDRIEFYINDVLVHVDHDSPYTFQWDTSSYRDGRYIVKVKAYDVMGMSSEVTIIVTVDNTPPQGEILSPIDGTLVRGIVDVTVQFTDNIAVKEARLYIDGNLVISWSAAGTYSYEWDTTQWTDETHTVKLVIEDEAGHVSEVAIHVIVDNTPPVIESIHHSPEKPSENQEVTVKVKASDGLGKVDRVILYYRIDEGEWIAIEMTLSNETWIATIPGQKAQTTIQYYVEVWDEAGNVTTSETYTYTVKAPPVPQKPIAILTLIIAIIVIAAIVTILLYKRKQRTPLHH